MHAQSDGDARRVVEMTDLNHRNEIKLKTKIQQAKPKEHGHNEVDMGFVDGEAGEILLLSVPQQLFVYIIPQAVKSGWRK